MRSLLSEADIKKSVVELFTQMGAVVEPEYSCDAGRADIVVNRPCNHHFIEQTIIYELKGCLSRPAFFQALGQVLIYRQCIDPLAKAIIVGQPSAELDALIPYAKQLGVEVQLFPKEFDCIWLKALQSENARLQAETSKLQAELEVKVAETSRLQVELESMKDFQEILKAEYVKLQTSGCLNRIEIPPPLRKLLSAVESFISHDIQSLLDACQAS